MADKYFYKITFSDPSGGREQKMTDQLPFRYMAISDRTVCPEPVPDRANRLAELGVGALQVRDKSETDRTRYRWLQQIDPRDTSLLVNSRWDLAVLGNADGVHYPSDGLPPKLVKSLDNDTFAHGISTHSLAEIRTANQQGADYVTFGPIFPTPSKPNQRQPDLPGLDGLAKVTGETDLPVLALGGVTPDRVENCLDAGAYGIAGIRALFAPDDPVNNWKQINTTLKNYFGGA